MRVEIASPLRRSVPARHRRVMHRLRLFSVRRFRPEVVADHEEADLPVRGLVRAKHAREIDVQMIGKAELHARPDGENVVRIARAARGLGEVGLSLRDEAVLRRSNAARAKACNAGISF